MYNLLRSGNVAGNPGHGTGGASSPEGCVLMCTRIEGISFLLAAALACATPAFGQTFGQITGIVTDPSGGVVVGATVTVTNPQTNFTRSENSNTAGEITL